jgi:flagellar biosynthesis GTPase FlhF
MSASSPSAGGESPDGVRTYRGRTIEELIPRIRAELGPDAIILREREGLTGGIGGFFAQRCVEIDAQAAPRLNVYAGDFDEDEDEDDEDFQGEEEDEGLEEELEDVVPAADEDFGQATVPFPAVGAPEPEPELVVPEPVAPEPLAPEPPAAPSSAPFLDEASFAARLEEATFAADAEPDPEPEPEPVAEEPPAAAPAPRPTPSFIAFDELDDEPAEPAAAPEPPAEPEWLAVPETPAEPEELDEPVRYAEPEWLDEPPAPAAPRDAAEHEELDAFPAAEEPSPAPEAEPVAIAPEPEPVEPEPQAVEPEPETDTVEPEPEPVPARTLTPEPLAPAPWLAFAQEDAAAAERARPTPPRSSIQAAPPTQAAPAPRPSALEPQPELEREPEPEPTPTPPPAADPPAPVAPEAPQPAPAPVAQAPFAPTPATPAAQAPAAGPYGYGVRRRGGLLPAAERMLRAALDATAAANERRELEYQARLAALPRPAAYPPPPATIPVDPAAVQAVAPAVQAAPEAVQTAPEAVEAAPAAVSPAPAAIQSPPSAVDDPEASRLQQDHRRDAGLERRLVACGLSPSRAAVLVGAAISQRGPFSNGSALADDVRATIATSLPTPHPLPADRGAVAIIGAGGSGKTRCVAALAVERSRAGSVVSVASFGTPGREDELGELLHGEAVNVIPAMRTRATARAVTSARERGLVIVDTAAVTPGDGSTIDVIAEALHSFDLDGIYLAVPATLSSPAGAKLIDSFSAFDLTGLVATHVDETDQLGVIAELSMLTGIPLSYTHTGLDLQNAVAPADPEQIAAALLR